MKAFLRGFKFAAKGVVLCLKERNFRFHLCAACFVFFFAAGFYDLSRGEWAALLLTVGSVIALEAANTAVERLCDSVTTENNPLIGAAKDIAAGAVLISAVFAVIVGVFLLWDTARFAEIWRFFTESVWRLAALICAVIAAIMVVFLPKKDG